MTSIKIWYFPNKIKPVWFGNLEILASASRYQHRQWRRHQHRHCKKKNFSSEVFIFAFRSFLWIKHLWWSPFQVPLHTFLVVSAAVYNSFSVENLLAPASEERKSAVDVISGVLKTLTTESCILHVCKFPVGSPIRDHFLKIFCKF